VSVQNDPGQKLSFEALFASSAAPGWDVDLRRDGESWSTSPLASMWSTSTSQAAEGTVTQNIAFSFQATPSCEAIATTVTISLTLTAALDEPALASSQSTATHTRTLTPPSYPDPALAFDGSLDFGEVPQSSSDEVGTVDGLITLQVDGLAATCGSWAVVLQGSALVSDSGDQIPGAKLELVSVNGTLLSDGPCEVVIGCLVTSLPSGPDAADARLTLGFQLTIPPGTTMGTFQSDISAEIMSIP
jgi:hypothetical protein